MKSTLLTLTAALLAATFALPLQAGAAPLATWEPGNPEANRAQLEISLADRKLHVRLGDEVLASYDVAVGKSKHPTPTGTFHIRRIIWNPSWTPPNEPWARGKKPKKPGDPKNPMGRVKIFFAEPDYYIHGTDNEESIGTAASHGCIRMRNDDVMALAQLLMEHGGELRSPSWFRQVINRATATQEVRLSAPIAVRIQKQSSLASTE